MDYTRADFGPLRDTRYGIGFHWTTWTLPQGDQPARPFEEAVDAFDVPAFVEQAVAAGAGHVLFTSTHAVHHLPAPHPDVDRILPGRTCRRDLIGELIAALAAKGIRLILYYHHGLANTTQTPASEWEQAVGGRQADPAAFVENYCRIVGALGRRYGKGLTGFWFDSGYALQSRWTVPWDRLTAAAKEGHPGRLVCYNSGIEDHTCYTPCQDYWAGEVCRLDFRPSGPRTPAGLPWYTFTTWHADPERPPCGEWGIHERSRGRDWPPPTPEQVIDYLEAFWQCGGAVTFNLLCYQDGRAYPSDLAVLKEVKRRLSLV